VRRVLLIPCLVLALAFAGCGGDDGNSSDDAHKLAVAQAAGDVQNFCDASGYKTGEFYERAYLTLLLGVDALMRAYKENPDLEVKPGPSPRVVPTRDIARTAVKKLRRCGPDGRQQAERLQRAITAR
jgi:hypothetical protein